MSFMMKNVIAVVIPVMVTVSLGLMGINVGTLGAIAIGFFGTTFILAVLK